MRLLKTYTFKAKLGARFLLALAKKYLFLGVKKYYAIPNIVWALM